MSTDPSGGIVLVCCSVFHAEVQSLVEAHWPGLGLRVLDSMLHMRPEQLARQLSEVVAEELAAAHGVVLVYGECCSQMNTLVNPGRVVRTRTSNCCELLLGHEAYRRLSREGAFFLLPEWTCRWRQVFTDALGLSHDNATHLMRDMHKTLIYLDTGVRAVPTEALEACSEYCGLPYQVLPVSLESLRSALEEALVSLGRQERTT